MTVKCIARKLNKISVEELNIPHCHRPFIIKLLDTKSRDIFTRIAPYILGKKLLDIGTGIGGIAAYFKCKGYAVESVDVDDSSLFKEYPTKIYDGINLPFPNNEFDTSLIVHVLHHCSDRMQVLREALRTSKRVIFIEDTYRNYLEWLMISLSDMVGNNEFWFHKYSTPEEWRDIIHQENCRIIYEKPYSSFAYGLLYSHYIIFVIEKV